MEVKSKIKKEFTEYDQTSEGHLWTSVDLQNLKNEPKEEHPAVEVKVEKEEFAEYVHNDIDNHQLSTSIHLQELKDEPEENQPGRVTNISDGSKIATWTTDPYMGHHIYQSLYTSV
uniref:Uncharacterized protein LOC114347570 n=1 Tax=Diabrotica virgifera virgifera TaxID=50390 RepID=A0A6P7H668_DIAVI